MKLFSYISIKHCLVQWYRKRTWAGFMWDTKSVFEERRPGNENNEIENGWSSSPDIGHDYFATLRIEVL